MASLLEGDDSYEAAQKQKNISSEDLVNMLIIAGKHLKMIGENGKALIQFRIAKKIILAFEDDFLESRWFDTTVYESLGERLSEIENLLNT